MKNFGPSCSIKHGTNKLISSTQCHWGKVAEGSHFKFNKDKNYIEVLSAKDIFYIKDFETKNNNVLIINENLFPMITVNDMLEITYKEYELNEIDIIVSAGRGYAEGDVIYFNGGELSRDFHTGTSLRVSGVNEHGGILEYSIIEKGKYLVPPDSLCDTSTNGFGDKAQFAFRFQELGHRGWIDRSVTNIKYNNAQTLLTLAQAIPDGIKNGKLNVKKWEITLKDNYNLRDSNVISEDYEIINDIIPHTNIPKLYYGHANPDRIINHGFTKISQHISQHDERISKQEKELADLREEIKKLQSK
ncbi:conserved hypothetical protein [Gammaproteobacteria bacterium]